MRSPAPRVCLITPGHLASAPRVVKEARALVGAGYRVHVVAGSHFAPVEALDAALLETARWETTRVRYSGVPGATARRILRQVARRLVVRSPFSTLAIAARASHAETVRLGAIAARIGADLYVGHGLPGLAAAASAARACGCPYGFDAEDFHDAETDAVLNDPAERLSTKILQGRLLSGCSHLTAASPLIGRSYAEAYGVRPITVLNVFPRSQAPSEPIEPGPISEAHPARIYWFSQTVGPGRGIEAIIECMGAMQTPAELHLRGHPVDGYPDALRTLGERAGLRRPIHILAPGDPDEMARLAAGAHLGLSTELRVPPNRDICLTNKIFVYLLAGIPQVLSNTTAQAALAPELGQAALLADLGEPRALSAALDEFLSSPVRMAAARARARDLGLNRYCWDLEKSIFLDSIGAVVPLADGPAS